MRVELIGGPLDGKTLELSASVRRLFMPISRGTTEIFDGVGGHRVVTYLRLDEGHYVYEP